MSGILTRSSTSRRREQPMASAEEEILKTTPPKSQKLSDAEPQTPSPSRFFCQMNALDAALNHYFSPKKKSPGRSPARTAQRKLQFNNTATPDASDNDEMDEDNLEEKKPKVSQKTQKFGGIGGQIVCDLASIEGCFKRLNGHLPETVPINPAEYFGKWHSYLKCGEFNILVHGLGSKRELLRNFCDYLKNVKSHHVFLVDGLNQNLSVQSMMERICQELGLKTVRGRKVSMKEWATALACELNQKFAKHENQMIILIVLNIDSPQLRARLQQETLAILVSKSKPLRIVASVDHVNSALLWDQNLRDTFSWLNFPISTLHCYGEEVLAGAGKVLGLKSKVNARSHTMESLDMFWEATTSNMRKILEQLAIHAPLQSEKNKRDPLGFPRFCQILKEEFATTSETALRQQLIEFRDHNIVQLDRDENIQLTVDRQLLSAFLDMKNGD